MFITIEGIDGCGKSTQARRLHAVMQEAGLDSLLNVDPGGTPLGSKLRQIVLDKTIDIDPWVQSLIFTAARADAAKKIQAHLAAGGVAVSDRWSLSTIVYQCIAQGVPRDKIDLLISPEFMYGLSPSLQIILSLEPLTAFERREIRAQICDQNPSIGMCASPAQSERQRAMKDRFESKSADFFDKLYRGYQALADMPNTVLLDVEGFSEEVVTSMIVSTIVERLPGLSRLAQVTSEP